VEKEIRAVLSAMFQRQSIPPVFNKGGDVIPFPGVVTITNVKISGDLRECKVLVTPFASKETDSIIHYFEKATPLIRKMFAQHSNLKAVPNFKFELDTSFEEAERIDELLRKNNEQSTNLDEQSEGV
jgi:ribosome-binding factor A